VSRQGEDVVMWYCMWRWVVFRFDSSLQDMHNGEVHPVSKTGMAAGEEVGSSPNF